MILSVGNLGCAHLKSSAHLFMVQSHLCNQLSVIYPLIFGRLLSCQITQQGYFSLFYASLIGCHILIILQRAEISLTYSFEVTKITSSTLTITEFPFMKVELHILTTMHSSSFHNGLHYELILYHMDFEGHVHNLGRSNKTTPFSFIQE